MTKKLTQNAKRTLGAASLMLAGMLVAPQAESATLVDFPLNEGPGSLTTASRVNGLVGTLGNPVVPENEPTVTTDTPSQAADDKALALNGLGWVFVDDSTNSILNLENSPFTMEAWIKPDLNDTRTLEGILGYGNILKMGIMNSGQLVFTLFGIVDIQSGMYLSYGEWHHVAAVWEPGVGVTMYLDGSPSFVAETRSPLAPTSAFLSIGAERMDNGFMGYMDRVRIHNTALTQEMLDSVAATPKAVLGSTLVAYNFSENAAPFQSSATAVRPAISSVSYLSALTRPAIVSDTPSKAASDYALSFTAGTFVIAGDTNNAIALNSEDPDFTLEAWVKFGAQPQARSVIYGFNGPGGAFSLSVTSDRKVGTTTYGKADVLSQAAIPDDGLWHHIAAVHENGKEIRFYVDGVLGDTVAYTSGVLIGERTDINFTIGGDPGGVTNPFLGLVDRIRVTSAALQPDQLDYLAVPGVNPNAPELTIATVLELSWPTIPAGYRLQTTTDVNNSASWTSVTNAPLTTSGKYIIHVPISGQKQFYRLVKQQ